MDARYSRQTRFAPIGEKGQRRLGESAVAVVGCGALGSVQAEILARAGVGRLRLIDRDFVELNNLQRQFLFHERDASDALPKAVAAGRRLQAINSAIAIEPVVADLTASNALEMLAGIDLVLDGTDNFETRYLINDVVVSGTVAGIRAWIYGAAVASYGLKLAIIPERTACLRCVYPEPPQGVQATCETAGVLGPVTAAIAAMQAADALKILVSGPESAVARLTTIDLWSGEIRQLDPPARDPDCPCCAGREFAWLDGSRRAPVSLCGRNAVQIHERSRPVDLHELVRKLEPLAPVRSNEFALRVMLDPFELTVFSDGRAIIKGTTDIGVARGIYARYVGV